MSVRFYLRLSGQILITLGVIVLGFVAYLYWGTAAREASAERAFASELGQQWSEPNQSVAALTSPAELSPGQPFALIRIPRFGASWQFAVLQGTGRPQLALGAGHVPGTAMPGMVGNFAVAGHRITAGNPFWRLPSLRAGDLVDVETIAGTYEYEVTGRPAWVSPRDSAVLAPVPDYPDSVPQRRLITLISCDPPWTGASRVMVTGVFIRLLPRQQGSQG